MGVWRNEGEEVGSGGDAPSNRRRHRRSLGERNLAPQESRGHCHPDEGEKYQTQSLVLLAKYVKRAPRSNAMSPKCFKAGERHEWT